MDFLTKNGLFIFDQLKSHCKDKLKMMEIDFLELGMLANAFDMYAANAKFCRDNGQTYEMTTKTGKYPMIRPEYNIMKDCYEKILKHSGKFGLNPGDRDRIFKSMKEDKKKKGFDLTGGMKAA
jgi:phage terminase small subunit